MSLPPAGAHPIGFWEEADLDPIEGVVAIPTRDIDPDTGEIKSLLTTITPANGMVIEAFRVERGSGPAVMSVGHTIREVRHTDTTSLGEVKARGVEPINELDTLGIVRLDKVEATTDPDDESLVNFELNYVDLTSAARETKTPTFAIPRQRTP